MKRIFLILIAFASVLSSCQKEETDTETTSKSSFPKLNGVYISVYDSISDNFQDHKFYKFIFNETDKCKYTSAEWSYIDNGWENRYHDSIATNNTWYINGITFQMQETIDKPASIYLFNFLNTDSFYLDSSLFIKQK